MIHPAGGIVVQDRHRTLVSSHTWKTALFATLVGHLAVLASF